MLILSAPSIAAATVTGLLIAIFQAVTQIQEQTLSFAVKLVAIVVTLFVTAGLIGGTLHQFALRLYTDFPNIVH